MNIPEMIPFGFLKTRMNFIQGKVQAHSEHNEEKHKHDGCFENAIEHQLLRLFQKADEGIINPLDLDAGQLGLEHKLVTQHAFQFPVRRTVSWRPRFRGTREGNQVKIPIQPAHHEKPEKIGFSFLPFDAEKSQVTFKFNS